MFSQISKKDQKKKKEKKEFNIYDYCLKVFGLKASEIVNINEKRTYKKFVEYSVDWRKNNESGTHNFKIILQNQGEQIEKDQRD